MKEKKYILTARRRICASAHFLLLAFLSFSFISLAHALAVPQFQGYVNDYANMLSPSAKAKLESELRKFEQTDSTQIAVLTIPSLEGEQIEDFTIKVAEAWGVGQKGKDNGVIFVVSKQDGKMRIEVGRGLEGRLPNLLAARILNVTIAPKFKHGDYDGGVVAGISALIDATKGAYTADTAKEQNRERSKFDSNFARTTQQSWIADEQTGCKVFNLYPKQNQSISWSGKCVDGLAYGYGILQWHQNGIKSFEEEFTSKNGAMMQHGVAVATVDTSSVDFEPTKCQKDRKDKQGVQWFESYRIVKGDVSMDIDLGQPKVVEKILSIAEQIAWRECPAKSSLYNAVDYSNVNVELYQNNELAVWARSYPKNMIDPRQSTKEGTVWGEFRNLVFNKRVAEYNKSYEEVKKKNEEETRRNEEKKRTVEEENRKLEISKQYDSFMSKYGIQEWPAPETVSTNPFIFEGKIVAIVADFEEMLSATQGIFLIGHFIDARDTPIIVSSIPKGILSKKGTVVLAGRGLGKTVLEGPLGAMKIPHVEFVGIHFCSNLRCSEIIPLSQLP